MKIRLYKADDREAVRRLAYQTAEGGNPSSFPAAQLQMDLLTRYYTDHESESLWIAESDGKVVGYLTGCLNSHRFNRWVKFRGNALTLGHLLLRNAFRFAIWRWYRARLRTLWEGGAHRKEWIKPYPAHLHINLAAEARGKGTGRALLEKFSEQCRAAQVKGIHLATRADNQSAQRFFKQNGFSPVTTFNAYKPGAHNLEPVSVLIMGQKLQF